MLTLQLGDTNKVWWQYFLDVSGNKTKLYVDEKTLIDTDCFNGPKE